jgi:C4-dicarboxylate transporter
MVGPREKRVNNATFSEFVLGAILAMLAGMALGVQGLSFYSFGVFITPLARGFGGSLSVVASPFLFVSIGGTSFQPLVGVQEDRIGAVRVIVFAIPMHALMLGGVAPLQSGVWIVSQSIAR